MRLLLLAQLGLSALVASASSVEGRLESIYADGFLANRVLVKPSIELNYRRFRLFTEGFAEADAQDRIAYGDGRQARAVLQQAWVETARAPITLRFGLQELRWSPSWILPSLDSFTARRYDRFFLDPLPEQLKHPLGLLIRYRPQAEFVLEGFAALRTPSNEAFNGSPRSTLDARTGGGLRAQLRAQGWIFEPLYAYVHKTHEYGFALSHPFTHATPRLEAGNNERDDFFVSGALDLVWKQWRARPQATFSSPAWADSMRSILHLPLAWTEGAHDAEVQALIYEDGDRFWSLEYGYRLDPHLRASAFVQDYAGDGVSLLGDYAERLPGWVIGLRVRATAVF
jgi:hypothetical protein